MILINGEPVTIGADPEIFIHKQGRFVNPFQIIPGTKEAPHLVEGGAVQVDGMALEFNIDPVTTYDQFQYKLDKVYETLMKMVDGYEVNTSPVITLPEDIPEDQKIMGCSPDLNVYTEESNPPPPADTNIRAAGGHIHIGGFLSTDAHTNYKNCLQLGKLMDKYVGVYSLLWDKDDSRRAIYGKAGSIRLKPYGMEYRVLSNQWLFNKRITKFVFLQTMKAVRALRSGEYVSQDNYYRNIIDQGNRTSLFFDNPTAKVVKYFAVAKEA
jgi:hypothetical protein